MPCFHSIFKRKQNCIRTLKVTHRQPVPLILLHLYSIFCPKGFLHFIFILCRLIRVLRYLHEWVRKQWEMQLMFRGQQWKLGIYYLMGNDKIISNLLRKISPTATNDKKTWILLTKRWNVAYFVVGCYWCACYSFCILYLPHCTSTICMWNASL